MHIAKIIMPLIELIHSEPDVHNKKSPGIVDLVFFDGASNVQNAGEILRIFNPRITVGHGAEVYPDQCPNGRAGSYYTFDPNLYGEHSWDDLKSMLTTPGCVTGCTLVLRTSKKSSHYRKSSHYFCCTHSLVVKDQSKSVYDGDNVESLM